MAATEGIKVLGQRPSYGSRRNFHVLPLLDLSSKEEGFEAPIILPLTYDIFRY